MNDTKHFPNHELACSCCGANEMNEETLWKLEALRADCGFPLPLSSAYRCPKHNSEVSHTGKTGPHTTGHAIDLRVSGENAFSVVTLAREHGFTGIGISQKGPHGSRYIHLDDLPNAPGQPRPWIWSY